MKNEKNELEIKKEESPSMVEDRAEVLDKYMDFVEVDARRKYLQNAMAEQARQTKDISKSFVGDCNIEDIISKKLSTYTSVDELRKVLKKYNNVDWFYTDDETGTVMQVDPAIPKEKHMEFKRAYLIYSLNTELGIKSIEEEQRKLDDAMKEFNTSSSEAWKELSDNLLVYTNSLKESVLPDHPRYKAIMEACKYIESAYTMDVLNEVLDRYPSVIKHTLDDMKSSKRIKEIGARYTEKLRRNGINTSLYPLLSTKDDESIEYLYLRPGQYKPGMENLFIFSCIRYFAMETWVAHSSAAKFHASLIVVLKKLKEDSLPEENKNLVMESISKYLERFQ